MSSRVQINSIFPNCHDMEIVRLARRQVEKHGGFGAIVNGNLGQIEEIDIKDIYASQGFISRERLYKQKQLLAKNIFSGYPVGVRINGKVCLIDGHHRVATQILSKREKIKIRVIDYKE